MRFKSVSHSFSTLAGVLASTAFLTGAQAQSTTDHAGHGAGHGHSFALGSDAAIPLNPALICGSADALYETQSECYGLYADAIKAYTKAAAQPYMELNSLEDVAAAFSRLNPTEIRVDAEKNTVTALFKNEEGKLHNPDGVAFIKVNPVEHSYLEMHQLNGNFYSTADIPSSVKYIESKEVRAQWDGPLGTHNPYGPAFVQIDLATNMMALDWAVNGVATSLNCEIGLTKARINLDTNIAFFRETASGSVADMQRRMHRNDGLHTRRVDPQTGADEYRIYRFHGDAAESDEISIEYFYDKDTGGIDHEVWALNGMEIPKIENYEPPTMSHHNRMYCMTTMDHGAAGHDEIPPAP